jgi:hypothetical protein
MKVHAFKIAKTHGNDTVESVLKKILESEISDRNKEISSSAKSVVRVEDIVNKDNIWYLDFIKIRNDHGPSKASKAKPVKGFELEEDEGFGEETAVMYDPGIDCIIMQYNANGVRSSYVSKYLNAFSSGGKSFYELSPKYDLDTERRFLSQKQTKKLSFKLDVSKMSDGDRAAGASLSKVLSYANENDAATIKVEISAGRSKKGALKDSVSNGINQLKALISDNGSPVTQLQVSGKENEDSNIEVLDLIAQRLFLDFPIEPDKVDKRYPREKRWQCLLSAREKWRNIL